MTRPLHRDVEALARGYARDLDALSPSKSLDARIDALVAAPPRKSARARHEVPVRAVRGATSANRDMLRTAMRWALAAALGTVAIALGVIIGVRIERAVTPPAAHAPATGSAAEPAWPPSDFSMWPTDSVALKIPAEVSPRGTLVAVDGRSEAAGARYWVDIVVSNDGTVRIENIVPAGATGQTGDSHGVTLQNP